MAKNDDEILKLMQGAYFPKSLESNYSFLYEYSELQKAVWKLKAVLSTRCKNRFYYCKLIGSNSSGPDKTYKRVVIQPRNLSPNPGDDFEADIFLALTDPLPLDVKVYINNKQIMSNGISTYFKAPRTIGKPQELNVEIYTYLPDTESFAGAYFGRFVF